MIIKKKYFRKGRKLISISAFLNLPWTEQLIQKRINRILLKRLYARLKRNKRLHASIWWQAWMCDKRTK